MESFMLKGHVRPDMENHTSHNGEVPRITGALIVITLVVALWVAGLHVVSVSVLGLLGMYYMALGLEALN